MITDDLIVYIRNQIKSGADNAVIRKTLAQEGWTQEDIDLALAKTAGMNEKLTNPVKLFIDAWKIFKSKSKKFINLGLYAIFLNFLVLLAFIILVFASFLLGRLGGSEILSYVLVGASVLFFTIALSVISAKFAISVILALDPVNDLLSHKELFKKSGKKVLPYWWLSFLIYVYFMFGLLLFIFPGFIFMVFFSFSIYILIYENIGGINAMYVSFGLVRDRFWPVAGRLAAIFFFLLAFSYLSDFIPGAIASLFDPSTYYPAAETQKAGFYQVFGKALVYGALRFVAVIFESFILVPVSVIYHVLLFRELRQNFAGSFITTPRKTRRLMLIPPVLMILLFMGLIALIAFSAASPVILSTLNNRLPKLPVTQIKTTPSSALDNAKPLLTPTQPEPPTEFETYYEFKCGYSVVYTGIFLEDKGMSYSRVTFTGNSYEQEFSILCRKKIEKPEVKEEFIQEWYVDGVLGTMYGNIKKEDGTLYDSLILKHPEKDFEIELTGYGEYFDGRINSFAFN